MGVRERVPHSERGNISHIRAHSPGRRSAHDTCCFKSTMRRFSRDRIDPPLAPPLSASGAAFFVAGWWQQRSKAEKRREKNGGKNENCVAV